MASQLITVSITTNSGGAFSATTPPLDGEVAHYRYVPAASNELDTGADLDIVGSVSGVVIANQDNIGTSAFTRAPRQATHTVAGAGFVYASGGEAVADGIFVTGEGLTVTIAAGGNVKSGTLYIAVR